MAKIKTTEPPNNLLQPELVVASSLHPDLTMPIKPTFQAFAGELHLVELDGEGNEIPGSDFSIGEGTFQRAFEAITEQPNRIIIGAKFRLKKNNQK